MFLVTIANLQQTAIVAHSQNGDHDVISTLCQLRIGTVRSRILGNTRITVYPLLYCDNLLEGVSDKLWSCRAGGRLQDRSIFV